MYELQGHGRDCAGRDVLDPPVIGMFQRDSKLIHLDSLMGDCEYVRLHISDPQLSLIITRFQTTLIGPLESPKQALSGPFYLLWHGGKVLLKHQLIRLCIPEPQFDRFDILPAKGAFHIEAKLHLPVANDIIRIPVHDCTIYELVTRPLDEENGI